MTRLEAMCKLQEARLQTRLMPGLPEMNFRSGRRHPIGRWNHPFAIRCGVRVKPRTQVIDARRASPESAATPAFWRVSPRGCQHAGCPTHSRRLRMSGNGENTVELDGKSVNETSTQPKKERVSGARGSQSRFSLGHSSRRPFPARE